MALHIEEQFDVRAPAATAWRFLGEPPEMLRCVPGAELTEQTGAERWKARLAMRAGPARLLYEGTLLVEHREDYAYRVQLRAEGRDTAENAAAHVLASISLESAAPPRDHITVVHLALDLDVGGRLAQLGPGMVDGVARQLLRQFIDCTVASLEPRDSAADDAVTAESLTLSGAYREHPMLRDTAVTMRAAPLSPPRAATAVPRQRESTRVAPFARLWQATLDRLRALGHPRQPR